MNTDNTQADPDPGPCTSCTCDKQKIPSTFTLFSLSISDDTRTLSPENMRWLHEAGSQCCEKMLTPLDTLHDIRICIVDDESMAALHQQHKQISDSTDVLTFDLRESIGAPLDTDVILCLDVAQRQANARSLDVLHELLLYTVHGLLHCLGFDDHDETSASVMHDREDEILRAIGLGDVFHMHLSEDTSSS